jgi:biotin operon repressor
MPPSLSPVAARLRLILETEGRGRHHAYPAPKLADRLGVSERQLRGLVNELVESGFLVGSSQRPGHAGLFTIVDRADLEEGTRTLVAHALSTLARVRAVEKAAQAAFGPEALHLFDIDQEAS